jgi:5-oxopent-3-ene-1,2,5-tricarboxylate decarboxylase/2-hydroxyhepta-2,4-diene-1,7-dioate isomerase
MSADIENGRVRVVGPDGEPAWGVRHEDRIVLEESAGAHGDRTVIAEAGAVYLPPLEQRPSKIVCVHLNFPSRLREYGASAPPEPSYFLKPPSSLSGHRSEIVRPEGTAYLNYEGEVALIIGTAAHRVRPEEALDHVGGVTVADDFGLHDFRHADRGSMLRVKGQDGYCPLGPAVVRPDVLDLADLRLRTFVNGELVQEGRSSELLFSYAEMIADIARLITLEPGDVILTGTPANSRPVEPGDVVEVEVEGVGRLSNTIVEQPVDWLDVGAQPADSPATRHVALAISEEDAAAGVGKRY